MSGTKATRNEIPAKDNPRPGISPPIPHIARQYVRTPPRRSKGLHCVLLEKGLSPVGKLHIDGSTLVRSILVSAIMLNTTTALNLYAVAALTIVTAIGRNQHCSERPLAQWGTRCTLS